MTEERLYTWSCPKTVAIGGELSEDDELWMCACSLDEVRSLIENPKLWINCINSHAGTDIKLAEHFVIKMSLVDRGFCASVDPLPVEIPSQFVVQGINNTGVITIRPGGTIPVPFVSKWDEYWEEWASETTLFPCGRAMENGQGYAHMELSRKTHTKHQRADRIAAFLMLGADPTKSASIGKLAPDLYMNSILRKKSTRLFSLTQTGTSPMQHGQREFRPLTQAELSQVNFLFQGRKFDFPDTIEPEEVPPVGETPPACDNKAGTILQFDGLIRLDDVTVKSYK